MAYGDILHQLRTNTLHQATPAGQQPQQQGGAAPAQQLQRIVHYVGLLADDSWVPWALEFCYQCQEPALRLRFLQGAEALQVYLELRGGRPAPR
jgi:hypothetical protein